MKMKITHYRIPELTTTELPKKGTPEEYHLFRYSRFERCFITVNQRYPASIKPYIKGGKTVCEIVTEDGSVIQTEAMCSMADNFNYKIGRDIAIGRALTAAKKYGYEIGLK